MLSQQHRKDFAKPHISFSSKPGRELRISNYMFGWISRGVEEHLVYKG
jgi:hypothetical protein